MSASPIITLGYGSTFGLPALIITLGYGLGSAPVIITGDTHDLPRYKNLLKKRQQALEARQVEKLLQAEKLRQQIDAARGISPTVNEDDTNTEETTINVEPIIVADKTPQLLAELALVQQQIQMLETQSQIMAKEARRQKDEREIQIILDALNPFHTRH